MQAISVGDEIAVVDDADYELVKQYTWIRLEKPGQRVTYASTHVEGKTVYMHRLILDIVDEHQVDHRDGNGLNNMRSNLRVATHNQNMQNTRTQRLYKGQPTRSKYKGVHVQNEKYKAQIWNNELKRNNFLGLFESEVEAARAYDAEAKKRFGDFARLNFPDENELAHLPLLVQLATQCQQDSEAWFGLGDSIQHHLLGIGGELGELIEVWKKADRGSFTDSNEVHRRMVEELTDVFIYILNVAAILDVDLFDSYQEKRARNVKRFGSKE